MFIPNNAFGGDNHENSGPNPDDPFGVHQGNEHSSTHPHLSATGVVGASALDGDGFGGGGAAAEFFYSSSDDEGENDFHIAGVENDLEGGGEEQEEEEEDDGMGAGMIEAERLSNVDVQELLDMDQDDDDDDFLEEDDAAKRRIKLMEEMLRFNDFNSLPLRYKLAGMIEPPVLGDTEISTKFLIFGRIYAVTVCTFALLHVVAMCVFSVESVESFGLALFMITTAVSAIDCVMRIITIAPRTSKIGMVVDVIILVASVMVILDVVRQWAVLVAILRGLRFMRVTILFEAFETMRDIYLVHRTIVASLQSLIVFIIVFMIGLFIFATGVWVLEQDSFDARREIWLRPCTEFEDCSTQPSPFQSIPDAMWLIGAAMTTVGLGDVIPSTTSARIVTGLAIIAGVFVVAFPTMILVGNLTAVRRAYFRDQERRLARLQVMAVTTLAAQQDEAGFADDARRASAFQNAVLNSFKTTHGDRTESSNNLQHINVITNVLKRSGSQRRNTTTSSHRRSTTATTATDDGEYGSPLDQTSTSKALFHISVNGMNNSMFGTKAESGVFGASLKAPTVVEEAQPLKGDEGMYCGVLLDAKVSALPKNGTFDFMGGPDGKPRNVVLSQTGQYRYVPVSRILLDCDRNSYGVIYGNEMSATNNSGPSLGSPLSETAGNNDGAPLISNFTVLDDDLALVTIHLVIDDEVCRSAAADALLGKSDQLTVRPITRALAIHGLEIALASEAPEGFTLLRRCDVGEILDDHVPIVFSVKGHIQFGETHQEQIKNIQDVMRGMKLRVMYRIHPKASSFWRCTHYIDKDLLADTLFIRELWSIAANVSAEVFMTPAQRATAPEEVLSAKRNVAYIPQMYIPLLLDELVERLSDPVYAGTSDIDDGKSQACITNRSHIETEVAEMIAYHCREVFFDELPTLLRVAIFGRHLVDPEDKLLEVDVDFFKHAEWPIGSVVVEYSPTESLIERVVTVGEVDAPASISTESGETENPLLDQSPLKSGVFKGATSRTYINSITSTNSSYFSNARPLVKLHTAHKSSKRIFAFTNENNLENSLRGSNAVEQEYEAATRLRRNKAITDEIAGLVGNTKELYIPPELLDNPGGGIDMGGMNLDEEEEEEELSELPSPTHHADPASSSPTANNNVDGAAASTPAPPSVVVKAPAGTKEPARAARSRLREEDFDDDYYNDILTRGKKNTKLNVMATKKKVNMDHIDYDRPIVKAGPEVGAEKWKKLKLVNKFANLSSQGGRFTGLGKLPTQDR